MWSWTTLPRPGQAGSAPTSPVSYLFRSCSGSINKIRSLDGSQAHLLPVLLLPEPLVFLLLHGQWSELLVPTSWHNHLYGPHGDLKLAGTSLFSSLNWPPPSSPCWKSDASSSIVEPQNVPDLNVQELVRVASQLRGWAPQILQSFQGPEMAQQSNMLRGTLERLDVWASALALGNMDLGMYRVRPSVDHATFIHSSADMFTAVRVGRSATHGY